MKIRYFGTQTGHTLDVVTFSNSGQASYSTGEAKPIIEKSLKRIGSIGTKFIFKSWSNGYVSFAEMR